MTAGWPLWRHQVATIMGIELRRRLLGRRAIPIVLVALAPISIFAMRCAYGLIFGVDDTVAQDDVAFAILFRTVLLRFTFFLGSMILFTSMIRGEVLDRSLHYWFLAPMHRGVLATGKFLAGLVTATIVFCSATAISWCLLYLAHGPSTLSQQLTHAAPQLAGYLAASLMACIGYGAVFLAVGVFFKTPIVPALLILGWESINFLLPATLKNLSVVHYVESIIPVGAPPGPLAVIADPAPIAIAVPGLILVAALLVWLSARRLSRMEILYGTE